MPLDTTRANGVAAQLLHGGSRFDFLLQQGPRQRLLEVKSCTLEAGGLAMFPDAVSARATRHLQHLADSGDGVLLFLVHRHRARAFLPDYHTTSSSPRPC